MAELCITSDGVAAVALLYTPGFTGADGGDKKLPVKAPAGKIQFVVQLSFFITAQETIAISQAVRSRTAEDG